MATGVRGGENCKKRNKKRGENESRATGLKCGGKEERTKRNEKCFKRTVGLMPKRQKPIKEGERTNIYQISVEGVED